MHARTKVFVVLVILHARLLLNAQSFTFDFSKGDSIDAIEQSGVELRDLGFEYLFALPGGTYFILLDNNNRIIVEADRGALRLERSNEKEVRKLTFYTRALNIEEGFALAEAFHKSLSLPLDKFYEWSRPIRNNEYPRDFYGNGLRSNYPEITMSVHSSFDKDIPFLIIYHLAWDNRVMRMRGISPQNNTLRNFRFDAPEILSSVESQAVEIPAPDRLAPPSNPQSAAVSRYDQKRPVEVIFGDVDSPEPTETAPEQPAPRWPWLIALLVLAASLFLFQKRNAWKGSLQNEN